MQLRCQSYRRQDGVSLYTRNCPFVVGSAIEKCHVLSGSWNERATTWQSCSHRGERVFLLISDLTNGMRF